MAKKNRPHRRKTGAAHAAPIAQAFPASVAAAQFLAICSEGSHRGQRSNPSLLKKHQPDQTGPI